MAKHGKNISWDYSPIKLSLATIILSHFDHRNGDRHFKRMIQPKTSHRNSNAIHQWRGKRQPSAEIKEEKSRTSNSDLDQSPILKAQCHHSAPVAAKSKKPHPATVSHSLSHHLVPQGLKHRAKVKMLHHQRGHQPNEATNILVFA